MIDESERTLKQKEKRRLKMERTLEMEWWNKTKWRAENWVQYMNKEMNREGWIQSKDEWMNEWMNEGIRRMNECKKKDREK